MVADAKAWNGVWKSLGKSEPAPDFKTLVAVAVFAGERMTGGFTVEFLAPQAKGADLIVRYRIKEPAGFAAQVISHPWKIRVFPKPKGKVIVEEAK
ncbi:MAG: protease complex subunit PrcB family protein [Elusimicrobia bacterium]|nr:protease complex subunit PrcB family protein [Elusimicrobiota bacterium]